MESKEIFEIINKRCEELEWMEDIGPQYWISYYNVLLKD